MRFATNVKVIGVTALDTLILSQPMSKLSSGSKLLGPGTKRVPAYQPSKSDKCSYKKTYKLLIYIHSKTLYIPNRIL